MPGAAFAPLNDRNWVRLRMRAALWHQWKTPRRRRAALIANGVSEWGQGRRPAVVVVLGILPEAEPSPPGSQMRTSSRSVSPPCSHRLDAQLLESPCTDRYA